MRTMVVSSAAALLVAGILALNTVDAFAQASFTGLGDLQGGAVESHAFAVSANGQVVVGWSRSATGQEAFRWTEAGGMVGLGFLPSTGPLSIAGDVSHDGSVVVGQSSWMYPGRIRAFRWASGTMESMCCLPGDSTYSAAYGVSANGQRIVGASSGQTGVHAFLWVTGNWTALGHLPGDSLSFAGGISDSGLVVVGYSATVGVPPIRYHAIRWTPTGGMSPLGSLTPGDTRSIAYGVSADGSVVVGESGTDAVADPFRWTAATGMVSLGRLVPGTYSVAWAVSDDGSVVVGSSAGAFIWTEEEGIRSLQSVLVDDYGLDLTGWVLDDARGVSADGRVIIGSGTHNGAQEAWRAALPPFRIIRPRKNELWISGEPDTIRWLHTADIGSVTITYSLDSGRTFKGVITSGYPADSGKYVWSKPDTLLSRKCRIRIEKAGDSTVWAHSPIYRTKGYDVTRVTADSNYERYRPNPHGWRFGNDERSSVSPYQNNEPLMWPQYWWQQFDYKSGIDPYTGASYPREFSEPKLIEAWSFPDWPLFVRAFGPNACYFEGPPRTYVRRQVVNWKGMKQAWSGSCTGFAISSFLAFNNKAAFRATFPDMPEFTNLNEVGLTDSVRHVINRLWISQFGSSQTMWADTNENVLPQQTIAQLKSMLRDESPPLHTLRLYHQRTSGGHEVNPYQLRHDPSQPEIWRISVYDSKHPNSATQSVVIDTSDSSWDYSPLPGWGGHKGLFLMDDVTNYLRLPAWSSAPLLPASSKSERRAAESAVRFYISTRASTIITDAAGHAIGYSDSVAFNTLQGGKPIIPVTGGFHPPIGYHLPRGEYSVRMSAFSDALAHFYAFTDSLVYGFERSGAETTQTDYLTAGSSLSFRNPDAVAKTIHLNTILAEDGTSEKVYSIDDLPVGHGDSLIMSAQNRRDLALTNVGGGKTYGLRVIQASFAGESGFEHAGIVLDSTSTHYIMPVWESLGTQPVRILIDRGNDGTIDDSVFVVNQAAGVDPMLAAPPHKYRLEQNYPNPFNPSTAIRYQVPVLSLVVVKVFDVLGREVATLVNEVRTPGEYAVTWDASSVASGVYLYRLQSGAFVDVKKLTVVK